MRNEEVNVSVESEGITVNDKVKELKVSPKIKSDFNDLQNYMA